MCHPQRAKLPGLFQAPCLLHDGREEATVVLEAVEPGNSVLLHRKPGRQLRHAVKDENGKGHGLAFGFQRFQFKSSK